ncbi:malate synthase A [Sandaracinus amylolyticus]|uniref:Malate synthase n=1 Tax=Sandaracinus amylolyticus TaxID=927083 RepID=A0A0F6SI37_9BACT|nr:malate synthase A [Sandaracinus amylolyticus]AKF11514.1 Malate synthase [Sandaracinus amylolyticus]
MTQQLDMPAGVRVLGSTVEGDRAAILTRPALEFVADLVRTFRPRIEERLAARAERHARFANGERLDFLAATKSVREGDWKCAPLPKDILDRRVEITGPVDRKMIINALNSGASVFMADFEDANAPTWDNCIEGQVNLRDAVARTISFSSGAKSYRLNDETAVLFVRPRGFHLWEKNVEVDGKPVPGMLFDFGLYFFHNAKRLLESGSGPYFYLPKMESHLEARVWNDVFLRAQEKLGVPAGSIKATCLIETLPGCFEMDEILYELRQHSAGLNCGRWDYIFSYIKVHATDATRVLPDRSQVGMTQPFMRAYSRLVIKTCHRRGVHAMGGMAAQIPVKGDEAENERAFEKVRADKLREVTDGHDGTWVAHPALVPVAKKVFDEHMKEANQIASGKQSDWNPTAADLIAAPQGPKTLEGLKHNVLVGIQYVEAWLKGSGAVPLYNLMEDAATAEISRTQVWQWVQHGCALEDGTKVTRELVAKIIDEEMNVIESEIGVERVKSGRFEDAKRIFLRVSTESPLIEFLTLPAYEELRHAPDAPRESRA